MSLSNNKQLSSSPKNAPSYLFWASFCLLLVLAALARSLGVGTFPAVLHNDEASCILHGALYFVRPTDRWALWGTAFGGHPNFSFWLSSLVAQLTGDPSLAAMRLASAVSGTLALALFALFLLRSYGKRIALYFLLFAAPYHFQIHFSRTSFIYVHSELLFAFTSLCFALLVGKPGVRNALLLGASLGLAALAYPATHVLPFCVLGALILGTTSITNPLTSFAKRTFSRITLFALGLLGFAVVIAPQVIDAIVSGYSSRLSATFVLKEHNLRHLAPQTGNPDASALEVVWFNFIRTLRFFTSYDEGEQYRFVETPMDLFFGCIAVVGALVLVWRALKRETIPLYLVGVAASTVAASAMMVEGPFSPHLVLFGLITPLAIAFGWDALLRTIRVRHTAIVTVVSVVAVAYWANWNWIFYNKVVSPDRSRMADLENAICFLPIDTTGVKHLVNLTPKAAGFGESYYQVMYPNATQTKLPTGDITKLEEFLRDKQCPCVVAMELPLVEPAKVRIAATHKKVTPILRPEKKLGFLYIEEPTP